MSLSQPSWTPGSKRHGGAGGNGGSKGCGNRAAVAIYPGRSASIGHLSSFLYYRLIHWVALS